MSSVTPQLAFPLTHAGTAKNPFAWTVETTWATKKTASPTYTAIAVAGDVTPTIDGIPIDVRQAGAHTLYGIQGGGVNYGFSLNIHPMNITFLKYGTEPPNYDTPAGTSAESLQFLMKYKQATGTAGMSDHYVFWLGCRPNTTTISVSAQGLVEASMDWRARQMLAPDATANGGLTTPTIPDFTGITGPVLQDSDSGGKPLSVNGVPYACNPFSITWNNNLIVDPFNGTGLVEALTVGGIEITGNFTTPVGQDLLLENRMALLNQTGVNLDYTFKSGTMVLHCTGAVLTSNSSPWEGQPTNTKKNAFNFKCKTAALATS